MDRSKLAYWDSRASRGTGRTLPVPLRPASADVRFWETLLHAHDAGAGGLDALLLGVTPSTATLRWPDATRLLALDWSAAMIRRLWPAPGLRVPAAVARGDWRQMPLASARLDLVIGDGCYAALASFADCVAVDTEVCRVLRPGGLYCMRCFLRPPGPEPLEGLLADLQAGRISEFELFIWRLAMALHGDEGEGVSTDRVWNVWRSLVPEPRPLFERLGWSAQAYDNMAQWGHLRTAIPFPTLAEVTRWTAPAFEFLECSYGDYEMGDRCARLVLRKR